MLSSALACARKAASLGHRNCSVGLHHSGADSKQVKLPFSRLMPCSVVVPPAPCPRCQSFQFRSAVGAYNNTMCERA